MGWTDEFICTCLLANTSSTASFNSSSASIRISSSLASAIRSRSLLSTTKIRPEKGKSGGSLKEKRKQNLKCTVKKRFYSSDLSILLCSCKTMKSGFLHAMTRVLPAALLTLRVLEVMPPKRPDLVLTANVPHGETNVLVFYSLHVKSCASGEETKQTLCNHQVVDGAQCSCRLWQLL